MTEFQSSPKLVYVQIQNVVNELLSRFDAQCENGENSDNECPTYCLLQALHKKITEQIETLEKNAEWDTYTIAFYGETNSGKSTIIESLRLLLEDEIKIQQQDKFQSWQVDSGVNANTYETLREDLTSLENSLKTMSLDWREEKDQLEDKRKVLLTEYNKQKFQIQKIKNRAGFFKRIKWYFKPIPYFPDFKNIEKELETHQVLISERESQFDQELNNINVHLADRKTQFSGLIDRISQAKNFADGAIIGNGRADFTHESTGYYIEKNGIRYCLLDIPGIEGNEAKVRDDISTALKKAHAVVYVTSKPQIPEINNAHGVGTFEKIKAHLSHHANVWTLYNKRVTNVMQLNNTLVSSAEEQALDSLQVVMSEAFGEHYQDTIPVSAYPAFLGLASCLLPGSTNYRSQEKFLSTMSREDLVEFSNIGHLLDVFNLDSPEQCIEKIETSNLIKAKKVAQFAMKEVRQLQSDKFAPLLVQTKAVIEQTKSELHTHLNRFNGTLKARADENILLFEHNARVAMYDQIDNGTDNALFKKVLADTLDAEQQTLAQTLSATFENDLSEYYSTFFEVMTRQYELLIDIIDIYHTINEFDYQLNSEIKIVKLINGLIQNNHVEVSLGAYQTALSFLSDEYTRSSQRKITDENLRGSVSAMNDSFDINLQQAMDVLTTHIEQVHAAMLLSIKPIQDVHDYLDAAEKKFAQLVLQLEAN